MDYSGSLKTGFKNIFSLFSCYYKLFCAVLASLARCLQYTPQARCKCRRNYSRRGFESRLCRINGRVAQLVEHDYFFIFCCNVRPFRANAGWFTGRRAAQAVSAIRRRSGSSPDGVQTLWRNLIEPANLVAHPFLWHKKQMPKELQHRVPEVAGSSPAAATSMAAWRSRLARGT